MKQRGFTLIELMTVLLVLIVMVTIAAPGFSNLIKNSRILSESYALRASLSNARSEALARRVRVVVCESADGATCASSTTDWSNGYLAFADGDADGAPDPNEIVIRREITSSGITIGFEDFAGTALSSLTFSPRGDALGTSGAMILCDDRNEAEARAVIVRSSGQVSAANDADDNGIVDYLDNAGSVQDVGC